LTGNAIRVPTPDVSIAVLNLSMSRALTHAEVHNYLRDVSLGSALRPQLAYIDAPELGATAAQASTDAGVVHVAAPVAAGERLERSVWYDNEFGCSCQVARIIEQLAGAQHAVVPARTALDKLD